MSCIRERAYPIWIFLTVLLCHIAHAEVLPEPNGPIRIGVIAPLSGNFASYGDLIRRGVESGVTKEIKLIFEDDGCEPAKAIAAFHKLHDVEKVQLFIGPCCGSPQQAVAPLIAKAKAIAILPSSASSSLFEESDKRIFSAQYSIEQESKFNAHKIFEQGGKRVVVLFSENQFSQAHEAAFRAEFKGDILKTISIPSFDNSAIKSVALQVRSLKPDALYVPDVVPFFTGLLKQLKIVGLEKLKVYSVYSAQSSELLRVEGIAANDLQYSYPDIAQNDALSYFPELATQFLSSAAIICKEDPDCIRSEFLKDPRFDSEGVVSSQITLRIMSDFRTHSPE